MDMEHAKARAADLAAAGDMHVVWSSAAAGDGGGHLFGPAPGPPSGGGQWQHLPWLNPYRELEAQARAAERAAPAPVEAEAG